MKKWSKRLISMGLAILLSVYGQNILLGSLFSYAEDFPLGESSLGVSAAMGESASTDNIDGDLSMTAEFRDNQVVVGGTTYLDIHLSWTEDVFAKTKLNIQFPNISSDTLLYPTREALGTDSNVLTWEYLPFEKDDAVRTLVIQFKDNISSSAEMLSIPLQNFANYTTPNGYEYKTTIVSEVEKANADIQISQPIDASFTFVGSFSIGNFYANGSPSFFVVGDQLLYQQKYNFFKSGELALAKNGDGFDDIVYTFQYPQLGGSFPEKVTLKTGDSGDKSETFAVDYDSSTGIARLTSNGKNGGSLSAYDGKGGFGWNVTPLAWYDNAPTVGSVIVYAELTARGVGMTGSVHKTCTATGNLGSLQGGIVLAATVDGTLTHRAIQDAGQVAGVTYKATVNLPFVEKLELGDSPAIAGSKPKQYGGATDIPLDKTELLSIKRIMVSFPNGVTNVVADVYCTRQDGSETYLGKVTAAMPNAQLNDMAPGYISLRAEVRPVIAGAVLPTGTYSVYAAYGLEKIPEALKTTFAGATSLQVTTSGTATMNGSPFQVTAATINKQLTTSALWFANSASASTVDFDSNSAKVYVYPSEKSGGLVIDPAFYIMVPKGLDVKGVELYPNQTNAILGANDLQVVETTIQKDADAGGNTIVTIKTKGWATYFIPYINISVQAMPELNRGAYLGYVYCGTSDETPLLSNQKTHSMRDIFGAGDTGKQFQRLNYTVNVTGANKLVLQQRADASEDAVSVYAPSSASGRAGTTAEMTLSIKNNLSTPVKDIVVIDQLPHVGNKSILQGTNLDSKWSPVLKSVTLPATASDAVIYYSTGDSGDWTSEIPELGEATSLKIDFGSHTLASKSSLEVKLTFWIPDDAANGLTAYNMFAASYATADGVMPTLESLKLGLTVSASPIPPTITAQDLTLLVGDSFDPTQHATAHDAKDGVIHPQVTANNVNTDEVGIYHVTYTATNSAGLTSTKTIQVSVQSAPVHTPPVITASDRTLYVGSPYDPLEGVSAFDIQDGDVTASIRIEENNVDRSRAGSYNVTYVVANSYDIEGRKTITVTVEEIPVYAPPIIAAADRILQVGEEFHPLDGVSAYDAQDGDLTASVGIRDNNVNTGAAGIYHITYAATNSKGLTGTKTFQVTVQAKPGLAVLETQLSADPASGSAVVPDGVTSSGGTVITYTIHLRNSGESDANNINISDPIPAHTEYLKDSAVSSVGDSAGPGGDLTGNTLSWTIPLLKAGESAELKLSVKVDAMQSGEYNWSIANTATVNAQHTNTVEHTAKRFVKLPSSQNLTAGSLVDYTLSGIGNPYGGSANNYIIEDIPPEGLIFVSAVVPAFSGGEGQSYSVEYQTNANSGYRVLLQSIPADRELRFTGPVLLKRERITSLILRFSSVPQGFAADNSVVYTFQVDDLEAGQQLVNRGSIRYAEPGNIPGGNSGGSSGSSPGGTSRADADLDETVRIDDQLTPLGTITIEDGKTPLERLNPSMGRSSVTDGLKILGLMLIAAGAFLLRRARREF